MEVPQRSHTDVDPAKKANKLTSDFYHHADVVAVAKQLLGKKLVTNFEGELTSALITEVEAYSGFNDKACHANNGLRTARTEVMYKAGGHAYVYLCYGIHHMLNIVTNVDGKADAVLIRAVEPLEGIEAMLERRRMKKVAKALTSGPGNVGQALGLNTKLHSGCSLLEDHIWLENRPSVENNNIVATTRIGVGYAEEDALKPWRFYIKDSKWISKK